MYSDEFMELHRNSQKRFYGKDYTYFVTVVTQNRIPYFEEEIFCEVFYENLKMSIQVKGFMLHGWFLGYDHFHMLLALGDEFNISNIMQFLKRHVSRDVNFLMNEYHEGEIRESRLHNGTFKTLKPIIDVHDKKLKSLQKKFRQKYPHENNIPFPKFQWQ